jgi:hypothetical protein
VTVATWQGAASLAWRLGFGTKWLIVQDGLPVAPVWNETENSVPCGGLDARCFVQACALCINLDLCTTVYLLESPVIKLVITGNKDLPSPTSSLGWYKPERAFRAARCLTTASVSIYLHIYR